MIYEIFSQKHAITIMIVKVISTVIWDHKRVLLSAVANYRIFIYIWYRYLSFNPALWLMKISIK